MVNVLCSKLYNPGPGRRIAGDDAASEWLQGVYQDCLINALCQRADRMSTLNGLSAFQVAATGDPARPIKYQLWSGWHEVIPFELPGKANEIAAVVTIDCVDHLTRYTYWTDEFYRVYETDKIKPFQTTAGRTARLIKDGENPYGVLPFAFVWYELPTSGVDSVHGLGEFLSELNGSIDVDLSDMAQAFQKYQCPTPVIYDGDVGWQPVKRRATGSGSTPCPRTWKRAPRHGSNTSRPSSTPPPGRSISGA